MALAPLKWTKETDDRWTATTVDTTDGTIFRCHVYDRTKASVEEGWKATGWWAVVQADAYRGPQGATATMCVSFEAAKKWCRAQIANAGA